MPESLSIEKQLNAKKKYNDKKEEKALKIREDFNKLDREEGRNRTRKIWIGFKNFLRPVTTVFEPLALLGPRKRDNNGERGGLDWSLPILAVTTGLYSMMMVSSRNLSLTTVSPLTRIFDLTDFVFLYIQYSTSLYLSCFFRHLSSSFTLLLTMI